MTAKGRKVSLAAGLACLAVLLWALLEYRPVPTVAAAVLAVTLLTIAARRRRLICGLASSAAVSIVLWAAFFTAEGYFWLNRWRLEALAQEIAATPEIVSLQLGQDDRRAPTETGRSGTPEFFDSYRFINGMLVTHYRRQAAPEANQPVLFIDDVLAQLRVPADRYWRLTASLRRLSLGSYRRGPGAMITLDEPPVGGQPWGFSYVYSPSGSFERQLRWQEIRQLTPYWYRVLWG